MKSYEVDPQMYQMWGNMSALTVSSSQSKSTSTLSKSPRSFQRKTPVGDQISTLSFYGGTSTLTPGPGSYEGDLSMESCTFSRSRACDFGSSARILSDSRKFFLANEDISISSRSHISSDLGDPLIMTNLNAILAVTRWKLRILNDKIKRKESLSAEGRKVLEKEIRENYAPLKEKIKRIKKSIQDLHEISSQHQSKFPEPKKPPFTSSSKRFYQKEDIIQEHPHFYLSPSAWDFGAETRSKSIDMSAEKHVSPVSISSMVSLATANRGHLTPTLPRIQSLARPRPLGRETVIFDDYTKQGMTTPGAGYYDPERIPPNKVVLSRRRPKKDVRRGTKNVENESGEEADMSGARPSSPVAASSVSSSPSSSAQQQHQQQQQKQQQQQQQQYQQKQDKQQSNSRERVVGAGKVGLVREITATRGST